MLEHGVWARKCHREFLLHVTILVQAANIFMSERFIRRTMVEMNSSMSLTSGRKIPEMLIGIPPSPLSRLHQRVSLMLLMSKNRSRSRNRFATSGCWILMVPTRQKYRQQPPARFRKKSQYANSRHTLSPWRVIIMIISSPRPGSYTCADDVASLCSVLRH